MLFFFSKFFFFVSGSYKKQEHFCVIGVVIFLVNLCLWLYAKIFSGLFLLRIFCYKSCVKIHVRIKKSSLTLKQEISNFDDFFFKPKLSESRPYLAKFSFSDMGNEFFFSYTIFDTVIWILFSQKRVEE